MQLTLKVLPDRLSVCRLAPDADLPTWCAGAGLRCACWTEHETSIVCATSSVPTDVLAEHGWRALAVAGPLDFALTGILASLVEPLARTGISVFALSTFDTDYVLVRSADMERACEALASEGHVIETAQGGS